MRIWARTSDSPAAGTSAWAAHPPLPRVPPSRRTGASAAAPRVGRTGGLDGGGSARVWRCGERRAGCLGRAAVHPLSTRGGGKHEHEQGGGQSQVAVVLRAETFNLVGEQRPLEGRAL